MTKWTDELIAEGIDAIASKFNPKRMPSNSEVISFSGNYSLAVAIQKHGGYKYWANRLGLEQKYSETILGIGGENHIAELLRSLGYDVSITSVKHPYDLLINGCVKIDVKTANTSYIRGYPTHAYRLAKRQHTCDFYIFYEADTESIYVVPAHVCSGQVQVDMGTDSKQYAKYKDAFDLIDKATEFYESISLGGRYGRDQMDKDSYGHI